MLASVWHYFGIILISFWHHFGITLGSLSDHFGMILGFFGIPMVFGEPLEPPGGTRGVKPREPPAACHTLRFSIWEVRIPSGKPSWGIIDKIQQQCSSICCRSCGLRRIFLDLLFVWPDRRCAPFTAKSRTIQRSVAQTRRKLIRPNRFWRPHDDRSARRTNPPWKKYPSNVDRAQK